MSNDAQATNSESTGHPDSSSRNDLVVNGSLPGKSGLRLYPVTDADVVDWISRAGLFTRDLVPYLYANAILKKGQPVECSRWGVDIKPVQGLGPHDDTLVSIHEAGHAIVFMELGAKFQYIEFGGLDTPAHLEKINIASIGPPGSMAFWRQSDADAISIAGGAIATSQLLHGKTTQWTLGCATDFVFLCVLEMQNSYNAVNYMVGRASEIVLREWKVVEALAEHLRRYRRTTYAQCMRIARKVKSNRVG